MFVRERHGSTNPYFRARLKRVGGGGGGDAGRHARVQEHGQVISVNHGCLSKVAKDLREIWPGLVQNAAEDVEVELEEP